jgi:hypothetical protein
MKVKNVLKSMDNLKLNRVEPPSLPTIFKTSNNTYAHIKKGVSFFSTQKTNETIKIKPWESGFKWHEAHAECCALGLKLISIEIDQDINSFAEYVYSKQM